MRQRSSFREQFRRGNAVLIQIVALHSGNARVRKIMIQLAWRMVKFQPDSALVQWFKQRTENAKGSRKPMIVALARKLIIALWRYANDGVIPEGFRLHSAA